MKFTASNEVYGDIVYEESLWTGKKQISIGGERLEKFDKTTFIRIDPETESKTVVRISGNSAVGVKLTVGDQTVQIVPRVSVFEILFSVLIAFFSFVWGNTPALCVILPIVGGALGGLNGGAFIALCFSLSKTVKEPWKKALVGLGCLACAFIIGLAIGSLIVATL